MKKIIGMMPCLLLIVLLISQSAFAMSPSASDLVITIKNAGGDVGSIVKVPICINGAYKYPVNSIDMKLIYNLDALELISIDPGEIVTNPSSCFSFSTFKNYDSCQISILFKDESNGKSPIIESGIFANLNFKIKKLGKSWVNLDNLLIMSNTKSSPLSYGFYSYIFGTGLVEGTVDGKSVEENVYIEPGSIKVDKSALTDVSVTMPYKCSSLANVKNGTSALSKGTDYTVSGNTAVIKKSYLDYYFTKFPEQNLYLNFEFIYGNNAILCIYTGEYSSPSISSSDITYDIASGEDIALNIELNGNYICSIVNSLETLIPRIDYTYSPSDKTLIIKKGYLNSYFSKNFKEASIAINFYGGSFIRLSVNPVDSRLFKNRLKETSANFEAGSEVDLLILKNPPYKAVECISCEVSKGNVMEFKKGDSFIDNKYGTTTIKAAALNMLPEGNHTLIFHFVDGNTADFNLTIIKWKGITVTVGSVKSDTDNMATIPVSIKGITTPINSLNFQLCYDKKAADIVAVTPGDAVPSFNFAYNINDGSIAFATSETAQKSGQISKDGIFANIKIKLKPGFSGTFISHAKDFGFVDADLFTIPVLFIDGAVS
ncbi:MAG TPA: cohesin domain-containing protein, partial [Clostridia bacterium]